MRAREAQAGDGPTICQIRPEPCTPRRVTALETAIADPDILVVSLVDETQNSLVVGYCRVEELADPEVDNPGWYVRRIWVTPELRPGGALAAVWSVLVPWVNTKLVTDLYAVTTTRIAPRFHRYGFQPTGIEPFLYPGLHGSERTWQLLQTSGDPFVDPPS